MPGAHARVGERRAQRGALLDRRRQPSGRHRARGNAAGRAQRAHRGARTRATKLIAESSPSGSRCATSAGGEIRQPLALRAVGGSEVRRSSQRRRPRRAATTPSRDREPGSVAVFVAVTSPDGTRPRTRSRAGRRGARGNALSVVASAMSVISQARGARFIIRVHRLGGATMLRFRAAKRRCPTSIDPRQDRCAGSSRRRRRARSRGRRSRGTTDHPTQVAHPAQVRLAIGERAVRQIRPAAAVLVGSRVGGKSSSACRSTSGGSTRQITTVHRRCAADAADASSREAARRRAARRVHDVTRAGRRAAQRSLASRPSARRRVTTTVAAHTATGSLDGCRAPGWSPSAAACFLVDGDHDAVVERAGGRARQQRDAHAHAALRQGRAAWCTCELSLTAEGESRRSAVSTSRCAGSPPRPRAAAHVDPTAQPSDRSRRCHSASGTSSGRTTSLLPDGHGLRPASRTAWVSSATSTPPSSLARPRRERAPQCSRRPA